MSNNEVILKVLDPQNPAKSVFVDTGEGTAKGSIVTRQIAGTCVADDQAHVFPTAGTIGNFIANGIAAAIGEPATGLLGLDQTLFYDALTDKLLPKRGTSEIEPFTTVTVLAGTGVTTIGTIDNVGDYKGAAISMAFAGLAPGDFIVITFKTAGTIFYAVLTSHIIAEDGTYTFRISPALANTHGLVAGDHVPRQMTVEGLYLFAGDVTVDCVVNWFN